VEFALIAPLFFLLLFGTIEGGRFIFYYEMLNNATREGARYAIVHGANSSNPTGPPDDTTGTEVKQVVQNAALNLAGSGELFVPNPVWRPAGTLVHPKPGDTFDGANNRRGSYVTVFVNYTYSPLLAVLPPITISAESTLVVNN
jgi:Flp pilus assembly protein TadG